MTDLSHTDGRDIPVIVLCGGLGIRMGDERPKMLVEVGEHPVLWHVMKIYAAQGFKRFVLALGYKGDMIKQYFLDYGPLNHDFTLTLGPSPKIKFENEMAEAGWQITFADTGLHTQTGSRIRQALKYTDGDTFFCTYGDGVADIDLQALLTFHQEHRKIATITGVRSFSRFGVMKTNDDIITGFEEKPLVDTTINGGFFVFKRQILDYLGTGDDVVLEQEPFQRLARDGQLALFKHAGFWRAMDTFKDAQQMNTIWYKSAPWKVW
jgi:glucose-1-phosphate cytidylyltransferase